jgi:hypothetical protein
MVTWLHCTLAISDDAEQHSRGHAVEQSDSPHGGQEAERMRGKGW